MNVLSKKNIFIYLLVGICALTVSCNRKPSSNSDEQNEKVLPDNPVFVFNNAFNNRDFSYAEIAEVLDSLEYDGIEHREVDGIFELQRELGDHGLEIFTDYMKIDLDAEMPYLPEWKEALPKLKGTNLILWVHIHSERYEPSDLAADMEIVPILRELADESAPYGIRIAIYPHTNFVAETPEDSYRIAMATERNNVGSVFNLCHFLKVMGDVDPKPILEKIRPKLFAISISGADTGQTTEMEWDRLIQPVGKGSYDVYQVVKDLWDLNYQGPIGFQCYNIDGNPREFLKTSMDSYRSFLERYQNEFQQ